MRNQNAMKNIKVSIDMKNSYKLGLDEVKGLKEVMISIFLPVKEAIQDNVYWNTIELDELEYKSRDGFSAYSSNCGGLKISEIIPKCEEYEFDYLEFGEVDASDIEGYAEAKTDEDREALWDAEYEILSSEGYIDALLRIIFKFEGFDDNGNMIFYINLCGGNSDAPYFRLKNMPDLFEAEFKAKTLEAVKTKAKPHIAKLLTIIQNKRRKK